MGLALVCGARSSTANGRFPASNQLTFSTDDPSFVALRTTFGILLSHDSGLSWSWLARTLSPCLPGQPKTPRCVGKRPPPSVHFGLPPFTHAGRLELPNRMFGFALSPDGSTLYVGGYGGLFVARTAALGEANTFQRISSIHVQCLATQGKRPMGLLRRPARLRSQ